MNDTTIPAQSSGTQSQLPNQLLGTERRSDFRPSVIESFSFIFKSDQWMMILLIGGGCMFLNGIIPFLPMMFYFGFLFFFTEHRIRFPKAELLEFDFDHFTKYLERGLWPMLSQVVWGFLFSIPATLIWLAFIFGGVGLASALSGGDDQTMGILVMISVGFAVVLILILSIFLGMFLSILFFRSGMTGSFKEAFQIGWAIDFMKRCGSTMILGFIGLYFLSMIINLLGMLVFCVGYYVTYSWSAVAFFNYLGQCYELYLQRGGTPIPLNPKARVEYLSPKVTPPPAPAAP